MYIVAEVNVQAQGLLGLLTYLVDVARTVFCKCNRIVFIGLRFGLV